MAGQSPVRKQFPIQLGGVLDESQSPTKVGGSGLTACNNLIYRRFGTWGKRAGSTPIYATVASVGTVAPQPPPAPPPPYTPPPQNPPHPPKPPPNPPPRA